MVATGPRGAWPPGGAAWQERFIRLFDLFVDDVVLVVVCGERKKEKEEKKAFPILGPIPKHTHGRFLIPRLDRNETLIVFARFPRH